MDVPTFSADGVEFVGINLIWGNWWICYRADDPERHLRLIEVPE